MVLRHLATLLKRQLDQKETLSDRLDAGPLEVAARVLAWRVFKLIRLSSITTAWKPPRAAGQLNF